MLPEFEHPAKKMQQPSEITDNVLQLIDQHLNRLEGWARGFGRRTPPQRTVHATSPHTDRALFSALHHTTLLRSSRSARLGEGVPTYSTTRLSLPHRHDRPGA